MKQKYYASRARRPLDAAALDALLETARRNNARFELTGLRVYGDNAFLQVVEGPDAAADQMFCRILGDPRHELIAQSTRQVQTRSFAEWQMGFQRVDDSQMRALPGWVALFDSAFDLGALPSVDPVFHRLLAAIRDASLGSDTARP